MNLTFPFRL
ncbi:hypothetical protein PVC01_000037800 [Plasmodium vivax]|uniref:Uncharacterized protein n=1 Tax=Plasmodium vivax TaxID=5855 RepID=A0A1G4E8U2_PLAVI|nr:hypothetical protein PVC01_000037800 [Plasmodium vivax]